MRVYDAESTRRRLLAAATADFAAHGIAGARVDRIATGAGVNKAQLYAYFGDKLGLFDAVFRMHADAVVDATPFTADDLPRYAVGLYDAALARPELVRLAAWARLERVTPGDATTGDAKPGTATTGTAATRTAAVGRKVEAIAGAQRAGLLTGAMAPRDVLTLVIAMALAWSAAGLSDAASPDDPSADHERRREALFEAVSGAFRVARPSARPAGQD
ncbi:TetR/AcrR family transcriptional regulator [Streptomyces corynorhini]|uniref:TetR/AcrR family transcriptional regulator n=1 Tax=Streptomyces corynorhini TaxID=2282652 RepID=A0A370ATD9_9ACTN|nr:TetR family transcriptional regulator [Streptomyces corynorhini]RDG30943.1 TetR/AcrR family transcriptional regulator [Streptomyces corynorhini]